MPGVMRGKESRERKAELEERVDRGTESGKEIKMKARVTERRMEFRG